MKSLLDREEILEVIRDRVQALGEQQLVADEIGCSPQMLSKILLKKEPPSKKVLEWLGVIRVDMYRRTNNG